MPSPYFTTSASPSSPLTTLPSSSSSPTSSLIMIHPAASQSQMPQISVSFFLCLKVKPVTVSTGVCNVVGGGQRSISPLPARAVPGRVEGLNNKEARFATQAQSGWRLAPGSAAGRKRFTLHASWFSTSQIATSVFSMGTAAVLPFYALMVFVPKANLTKKTMESSFPYVALGLVYAYLLHLSWTPDSVRLMFSGQYMLPELSGITKMFASEMTLASAWIHLLVVDLFAARQIFHDGLESQVETRHSVSLCLFCCPLGIFTHLITKALTRRAANKTPSIH